MKTVEIDQSGVKIGGEYKILLVSSLFYFRIPREKWEDRMKALKSAGYNAIDVYFPWNYHEVEPGTWLFDENRDIDTFLSLAQKNDLYVIARPGPYICSEWDGGGIPAWLYLQDIPLRQDDERYIEQLKVWYEKVLSIIRNHQITQGGSVIMLQLENELDYYNCSNPSSYMEKLVKIAKEIGMEIPFICCCGQDDIRRSGADCSDITPAFNIYSDTDDCGLEERCLHLFDMVQSTGSPFIVTETNREHSYLKRLLCCGAKMISPYNQTAGTTMDYYNAINNWGTKKLPLSLLASDYDFQSMISPDGTLTNEYIYARLLSGLINSFEPELAIAVPETCDDVAVVDTDLQHVVPCLSLAKGKLIPVTNSSKRRRVVRLKIGNNPVGVKLDPLYTALLPIGLQITDKVRIIWSNYEIAFVDRKPDKTRIALYGMGILDLQLSDGTQEMNYQIVTMGGQLKHIEYEDCEFIIGNAKFISELDIPGIAASEFRLRNNYQMARVSSALWGELKNEEATEISPVSEMEKHGQYRGTASYEIEVEERSKLLLTGAADIVSIYHGNTCKDIFFSAGETKLIDAEIGSCKIVTESWGHCNFEDIRLPSLNMGSKKGIEKIIKINHIMDITKHWILNQEEDADKEPYSYKGKRYDLMMDVDSYNKPLSPMKIEYRKQIYIPEDSEEFILHFSVADCIIDVYVNDASAGSVCPNNPYMDISEYVTPGSFVWICLKVTRRFYSDRIGRVKLFSGTRIKTCKYRNITFDGTIPEILHETQFPFSLAYGREQVIIPMIEEPGKHDIKFIFHGSNMILNVFCNQHNVGRIVLDNPILPKVAGGKDNELYICKEWLMKGAPVIKCQAIAKSAVLHSIDMKILYEIV